MARLTPLRERERTAFDADPYLRDIAERNLQVAIQCCLDIANRLISFADAPRPSDYHEAILRLGELGVLPVDFARRLAPMAGLRNVLVHEYVRLDWERVYASLQGIGDLERFGRCVRAWLAGGA